MTLKASDDQLGFIVQPINGTRQRYGSAHGDKLPWSYVEQWCVGLAIDQRDTDENPQYRILGLNLAATVLGTCFGTTRLKSVGKHDPLVSRLRDLFGTSPLSPHAHHLLVTYITDLGGNQEILLLWGPPVHSRSHPVPPDGNSPPANTCRI